jgi:hypothetical protein
MEMFLTTLVLSFLGVAVSFVAFSAAVRDSWPREEQEQRRQSVPIGLTTLPDDSFFADNRVQAGRAVVPIEALRLFRQHVITVHCKDGNWPPKAKPGALGEEKALGQGSVGIEKFVATLKEIGYKGPLSIEREASDPVQRIQDIKSAIALLEKLT